MWRQYNCCQTINRLRDIKGDTARVPHLNHWSDAINSCLVVLPCIELLGQTDVEPQVL